MKISRFVLGSILFAAFFAGISASASAQGTYVSTTGSDINPCSKTAPCRTFQVAATAVQPGGQVVALDSGEYGPVTVAKSLTLVAAPGIQATVSATTGSGVAVDAGTADIVTLRGLTIVGAGGSAGVYYASGQALHIENCVISGFSALPASFKFGVYSTASGNLEVKDSAIRRNDIAIFMKPLVGTALLLADHVRLESGAAGLEVRDGTRGVIRDSVVAANSGGGVVVGSSTQPVELNVENCVVSNNGGDGISAASQSGALVTVRVSNSTVTDNSNGLNNVGGALLLSRGNNTVAGNTNDTVGVIGSYSAK